MKKYYWEKRTYFYGECDFCHKDLSNLKENPKSRIKFQSFATFEGDDADDEKVVALCEECFLKTR